MLKPLLDYQLRLDYLLTTRDDRVLIGLAIAGFRELTDLSNRVDLTGVEPVSDKATCNFFLTTKLKQLTYQTAASVPAA